MSSVVKLFLYVSPAHQNKNGTAFRRAAASPWPVLLLQSIFRLLQFHALISRRTSSAISAISSTVTLFVFTFGVLLTLFWPKAAREDLSRGSLIRKGIAAAFVTAGVILADVGSNH